jgi:hypothetical protein
MSGTISRSALIPLLTRIRSKLVSDGGDITADAEAIADAAVDLTNLIRLLGGGTDCDREPTPQYHICAR